MLSYNVDITEFTARPWDGTIPYCQAKPATQFYGFNNKFHADTFRLPVGHESLVRFNNKVTATNKKGPLEPCNAGGRTGVPMTIHHHGAQNLAPFDGWATDIMCEGQSKDYVFPNAHPRTLWYHDHALHRTAENVYNGMHGMYIISDKKQDGGCGAPYNLDNVQERTMFIMDRLLDNQCQISTDLHGGDDLFGDINTVNGIPFPRMPLDPKWYRFRLLNGSPSRPFEVSIVDDQAQPVSDKICQMFASGQGYLPKPIAPPPKGFVLGVAERYQMACDFSGYQGKTLYFWNNVEQKGLFPAVPYYCHSHLIARIEVGQKKKQPIYQNTFLNPIKYGISQANNALSAFGMNLNNVFGYAKKSHSARMKGYGKTSKSNDFRADLVPTKKALDPILTDADILEAKAMADKGEFHRQFAFGFSGGRFTINGESWSTNLFAADNIGHNTWQVWKISGEPVDFHPVHTHLVTFYILRRSVVNNFHSYEIMAPKDVVNLWVDNDLWILARWGPHKGDYMFHCHNLIHEDNEMIRAVRVTDTVGSPNEISAQRFSVNPIFNIIYDNYQFADPLLGSTAPKPTAQWDSLLKRLEIDLNLNLYRIFYPTYQDRRLYQGHQNPWEIQWCRL